MNDTEIGPLPNLIIEYIHKTTTHIQWCKLTDTTKRAPKTLTYAILGFLHFTDTIIAYTKWLIRAYIQTKKNVEEPIEEIKLTSFVDFQSHLSWKFKLIK